MGEIKISQKQMVLMIFLLTHGTIFITLPRSLATEANHAGWVSILLAMVLFLPFAWLLLKCSVHMQDMNLVEYCHQLMGKVVGRFFTLVFVLFPLLLYSAVVVRILLELFTMIVLPSTPIELLIIMIFILRIYLVSGRLHSIARYVELIFPPAIFVLVMLLLSGFSNFETDRFKPLLDASITDIFRGSLPVLGTLTEAGILLFFISHVNENTKIMKPLLLINLFTGLMFLLSFLVTIGNYGVAVTERIVFPVIEVVKDVSLGEFLEHLESIFLSAWILMNLAKGSITLYASSVGFQSWFGTKTYHVFLIPLSVLIYFIALVPQNLFEAVILFESYKAKIYSVYPYLFLSLLLILTFFRKKGRAS